MTKVEEAGPQSRVRGWAAQHPVELFIVLAYTVSWGCWLPLVFTGSVVHQGDGWPTDLPGLAGPALAAVITLAVCDGRTGVVAWAHRLVRWRVPGWCYVFIAGTAALGLLAATVSSGTWRPDGLAAYTGSADLGLAATFLIVLVVNGLGEEAGWRGFLVDRLVDERGVVRTAVLVGVVWAGWHVPLFLVADSFRGMGVGVVGWLVGILSGSVVLTWLYLASGRSVLVVALWHTTFNFTSGTQAMTGLPAAVTSTAVIALAVMLVTRRQEVSHVQPDAHVPRRSRHGHRQPVPRGGR